MRLPLFAPFFAMSATNSGELSLLEAVARLAAAGVGGPAREARESMRISGVRATTGRAGGNLPE